MSSSVEAPLIEIDRAGDVYIKAFEYQNSTIRKTALIKVFSQVLIKNSDHFKEHLETHDANNNLELHHVAITALELCLRIFHENFNDDYLHLDLVDYLNVIKVGQIYNFESSKMSVWFSLWLGSQDLRNLDPNVLRQFLYIANELSHQKASEIINIMITEAESGHNDPAISTAFKCYPPVPVMSTRQTSILVFFTRAVPIPEYERWGFSPAFQTIYGEPLEYYSDFYRLVTVPFDHRVVPKLKRFTSLGDKELSRFLWFCHMSDDIARKEGLPVLKRRQMEAAWVWTAFDLYEKDHTAEHFILKKIISQRFHPRIKVEEYWEGKQAALGWEAGDVEFLDNGCEEDPETEKIAEVDEDEYEDMEMDSEGEDAKQQSMELAGLVDDLEIEDDDEKYKDMDPDKLLAMFKQNIDS